MKSRRLKNQHILVSGMHSFCNIISSLFLRFFFVFCFFLGRGIMKASISFWVLAHTYFNRLFLLPFPHLMRNFFSLCTSTNRLLFTNLFISSLHLDKQCKYKSTHLFVIIYVKFHFWSVKYFRLCRFYFKLFYEYLS